MYLNDCCSPGGSCPICNAIEPPEMELTYAVWEQPSREAEPLFPEEAYGLVRVITQDDPDDLPVIEYLMLECEPEPVSSMPGYENTTLTLDQIREIAELGHLDGELLTSEEL